MLSLFSEVIILNFFSHKSLNAFYVHFWSTLQREHGFEILTGQDLLKYMKNIHRNFCFNGSLNYFVNLKGYYK